MSRAPPSGARARGQLFSMDLLFAFTVFLFALTYSVIFANQLALRVESIDSFNHRQDLARTAMNAFLADSGRPANWAALSDLNAADSLGLVSSRNDLSPAKLQGLIDLNATSYDPMKKLLGLSRYDFEFTVNDLNGTVIASVDTCTGLNSDTVFASPDSNSNTVSINRLALYRGREVLARLKVFDCTVLYGIVAPSPGRLPFLTGWLN